MIEAILKNPNLELYLYGGITVICVVIVLMGLIKTILINKIQNKLVRKITLAFSSILMVFPTTLVACEVNGIGMDHYWKVLCANIAGTILAYWLYENTGLRNLINMIGKTAILKIVVAIVTNSKTKSLNEAKKIAKKTADELNKDAKNALKSAADELKDEALKNL